MGESTESPAAVARPAVAARTVVAPSGVVICEVAVGGAIRRLRVWSEAEWAGMRAGERPETRTHLPGLGWVGAVGT